MAETVNKSVLYHKASPIPVGIYYGLWSGYEVKFSYNGEDYFFQTDLGVRGINIPCKITLEDTRILVDTNVN